MPCRKEFCILYGAYNILCDKRNITRKITRKIYCGILYNACNATVGKYYSILYSNADSGKYLGIFFGKFKKLLDNILTLWYINYRSKQQHLKRNGVLIMKTVIYKENGVFKTTNEENYNRAIQNAREVNVMKDFESAEEIIEYFVKWFKSNEEDFIVIE